MFNVSGKVLELHLVVLNIECNQIMGEGWNILSHVGKGQWDWQVLVPFFSLLQ